MSLHGLKKAVARLPQQLSSTGSVLPEELIKLEHTLDAGEKALDVLIAQTKAYADALTGLLDSSTGVLVGYNKDVTKLSEVRTSLMQSAESHKHRIIRPSTNMKQHIAELRKVIAKRNRKKVDCDRFAASLKKHGEASGQDKKVDDLRSDHAKATTEYSQQNTILLQQLPKAINVLAKFLDSMLNQEHIFQMTTYKTLREYFEPLATQLHITTSPEALKSEAIVQAWKSPFIECKQAAEGGIDLIKMSKVPTMSMTQTSRPTRIPAGKSTSTIEHNVAPLTYDKPPMPMRPDQAGSSSHDVGEPPAYDGPMKHMGDHKS